MIDNSGDNRSWAIVCNSITLCKSIFPDPYVTPSFLTSNAMRRHEKCALTMPAGSHYSTGLLHITILTLVYLGKEKSESQCLLSLYSSFTCRMNIWLKGDLILMHFCEVALTSSSCQVECKRIRSYVALSAAAIPHPRQANEFVHFLKRRQAYLNGCMSL